MSTDLKDKIELNEDLGEVICDKCEGYGYSPPVIDDINTLQAVCVKCGGRGKVDWVNNVLGVNHRYDFATDTSGVFHFNSNHDDKFDIFPYQEDFINTLSKQLAEELDNTIIESLVSDSEQNSNQTLCRENINANRIIS
jgi:hypothetical protein